MDGTPKLTRDEAIQNAHRAWIDAQTKASKEYDAKINDLRTAHLETHTRLRADYDAAVRKIEATPESEFHHVDD